MELVSVAAIAENRVIGKDGEIPWPSIPEDRRQYRGRIADSPVILGRVTFESMLDDLPGSAQIVLSRSDPDYEVDSAYVVGSVEAAIDVAADLKADGAADVDGDIAADDGGHTAYIIGGAAIYSLFQPHLDRMVLTRVPGEYEGDSYYPEWDPDSWTLESRTEYDDFAVEEWIRAEERT